jgi:hypothetical protein
MGIAVSFIRFWLAIVGTVPKCARDTHLAKVPWTKSRFDKLNPSWKMWKPINFSDINKRRSDLHSFVVMSNSDHFLPWRCWYADQTHCSTDTLHRNWDDYMSLQSFETHLKSENKSYPTMHMMCVDTGLSTIRTITPIAWLQNCETHRKSQTTSFAYRVLAWAESRLPMGSWRPRSQKWATIEVRSR